MKLAEKEEEKKEGEEEKEKKKRKSEVRINDQDREMFVLLLNHRFLSYELLVKRFSPENWPLKKGERTALELRLYRMVQAGYLYSLKRDGERLFLLANSGLELVQNVNHAKLTITTLKELESVHHDLAFANLRFYFEALGRTAHWITGKQMEKFASDKPRVPDGVFRWNGLFVFLEVEFSTKEASCYEKIYNRFSREGGPDLVLYFYKNRSDLNVMIRLSEGNLRFVFFPYSELMPLPGNVVGSSAGQATTLARVLKLNI